MAKLVRKSPVPLYGAAAVWAVWGLLLPMYALWHLLAAAGQIGRASCRERVSLR